MLSPAFGMGSYLVFGRFWCVKVIKYTEKDLLLVGCMWILFQIIEQRTSGLVVDQAIPGI